MLNTVVLIGRLATQPELRYSSSGVAITTFRLAVQRPGKEAEADFIDIVTFKHAAEFAANYLSKGRLAAVDGRLQIRTWVAQDGTKRRAAEVVARSLRGLDWPKEPSVADSAAEDLPSSDVSATGPADADEEDFADCGVD